MPGHIDVCCRQICKKASLQKLLHVQSHGSLNKSSFETFISHCLVGEQCNPGIEIQQALDSGLLGPKASLAADKEPVASVRMDKLAKWLGVSQRTIESDLAGKSGCAF